MGAFIDLTDQRFGMLTVIKRNGTGNTGQSAWLCKCDCGREANVLSDNLRRGKQVSCGCYGRSIHKKHGMYKSSEFIIWQGMKRRCLNENAEGYSDYGGRGITVCDRWADSFENFYADMGKRTSSNHSIDRIDVNGNYEPSNCKWSTQTEQNMNRRLSDKNKSGHVGVSWCNTFNKWVSYINVNKKRKNIGYFHNIEDAIEARKQAELKYFGKSS